MKFLTKAVIAAAFTTMTMSASTIHYQSGDANSYSSTGAQCVNPAPNGVWPLFPGVPWVGPDCTYNPPNDFAAPWGSLYEKVVSPKAGVLNLAIALDDTGAGFLNGVQFMAPVFTSTTNCAASAPGCLPSTVYTASLDIPAGLSILQFDVYQLWGCCAGATYTADVVYSDAPEPSTCLMGGTALIILWIFMRKGVRA